MVFVSCQFYLALFTVNSGSFSIFFIDLLVLESRNSFFWKSWNFQGCITVYLSKISDSSLLLFSAATLISYHDRFRLSTTFYIYFSKHLQWHKRRKKRNLNLLRFFSYFLLVVNGERGIWTLAPVARPTPLAGAPLQPLEYFSIIWKSSLPICYWRHFVTQKLLYIRSMCLSIAFFINCRYCL